MINYLHQIDLGKLFNARYLLEDFPSQDGLYIYLAIFFGLMIILACVLKLFFVDKEKPLRNNLIDMIFVWLLTVSLIGLFWVFSRFEQVQYLGSRVVLLTVLLMIIVWGLIILYYKIFIIPQEFKRIIERQKFEKYLPRPKKMDGKMDLTRSRKGK